MLREASKPLDISDPRHGTINAYNNLRCRCEKCKAKNKTQQKIYRETRKLNPLLPQDPRHGKHLGYSVYNCRCDPCCAAMRDYSAKRYAKKADKLKENSAKYRADNPGTSSRQMREWRAKNPGAHSAYMATKKGKAVSRAARQRRRFREVKQNCGCMSADVLVAVWDADNGECYLCGSPAEHLDHLVPLVGGGFHCTTNVRPACAKCNMRKGWRRSVEDMISELGPRALPEAANPGLPCTRERVWVAQT